MARIAAPLPAVAAFVAAVLSAATAMGENAAATVPPGSRLHGDIVTPGDQDHLSMFLPAGSLLTVDLRPDEGSTLLPALEVLGPDASPIPIDGNSRPGPRGVGVKVGNLPGGEVGGVFTLRVIATEGTSGRYLLRTKVKAPRQILRPLTVPPSGTEETTLDAFGGSLLSYVFSADSGSALVPSVDGLTSPTGGAVGGADGVKGKRIPLPLDGTYVLTVRDAGEVGGGGTVKFAIKPPKPFKGDLYLSPEGFGPAPRVLGVTPDRVLDDRPAEGIEVVGEGFDGNASVALERKGEPPLLPTALVIESDTALVADFDTTGVRAGKWSLVVRNPSGGPGAGKFTVQRAGNVRLPAGVVAGTEVWWLEFDPTDFPSDLAAMGLGSSSSSVAAAAREAVKQYVLYFVRRSFGLPGEDGRVKAANVPVSFVLDEPPSQVGSPGSTYNRLRIGGVAAAGDPSSNPSYPWGDSVLDTGNATLDDVSRDGGTGRGVMARALAPSAVNGTDGWRAALQPLQATPLSTADAIYFSPNFAPADEAQGARYRDIIRAVEAVGRELGGTLAHFIGRSMGVADTASGVSSVPTAPGGFLALVNLSFSSGELATLTTLAKTTGLPGTSKTLTFAPLPPRETRPYLLPNATTGTAYSQTFRIAGGRPDRDADSLVFTGVAGFIPASFSLSATGVLSGTAPLFIPNQGRALNGGVFRFLVRARDVDDDTEVLFSHRLNLLVDADDPALSPAEQQQAAKINEEILATP